MGEGRLRGKRALVSGSGTGIGQGIALGFAREGADVVFHYSHSAQGALAGVEEVRKLGVRATALQADFSKTDQVKALGEKAAAFLGGVDVLVNNAGITLNLDFDKVSPEQFDLLYGVNVRAPFFLTQSVLPAMAARGGAIINISSIHAFAGLQEHSVYAGTRGAIVAFTRTLAMELAHRKIRVNCIAPGSILVGNYAKAVDHFDPAACTGANIPVGFIGQPVDIAEAAIFLASDQSRFILGQTLIVDGGTTAYMAIGLPLHQPMNAHFGRGYVPGV